MVKTGGRSHMSHSQSRRRWFQSLAAGAAGLALNSKAAADADAGGSGQAPASGALPLREFQPKSMLHVPETAVARARFPVIDVHTHVTFTAKDTAGVPMGEAIKISAPASEILTAMDRCN